MLNTLNRILSGLGPCFPFPTLPMRADRQPITRVSGRDSSKMPIRVNRKPTDMVASMPGNTTFNSEANNAASR